MNELEPIPEAPPEPARPERYPFWSYSDLFLFLGLAVLSLILGALIVRTIFLVFQLDSHSRLAELLPAQFLGYGFLFGGLYLLFRFHHHRPFWNSLGWVAAPVSPARIMLLGILMAFAVSMLSWMLKTPDIRTPMKDLLSDRTAVLVVAVFGVTLGPLCEELAFRGFIQPLFVRTLGPAPGVILAAAPFGLLHLQQYAFSWRHGLLITVAGAGFGWMRHKTGSTKAAAIMHAAYNGTFFIALAAQRKDLPHLW